MRRSMTRIADYEFLEELGEGNYGVFWRARPPARLGLTAPYVAVKVLHHRSHQQGYDRMANELRVYHAAASPHLVQIYDAGHEDGTIFYASEFSETGSLAQAANSLTRSVKLRCIADIARGAHALHEVGLAHRDVKLSNMMLFDGTAKLGDLGLAQILNPGQQSTGMGSVGSLAHLAPETIRGEKAGRASDVFALGVSLHSLLCGASVFPGLDGLSLRDAFVFMLQPTTVIHPSLSESEARLVAACVAVDSADRPSTADEFARKVELLASAVESVDGQTS